MPELLIADALTYPLENYRVNSYAFGEDCWYDGVHWGVHLGEDVDRPAGTPVRAIGHGRVVYSALHVGSSQRRNWGNIIIIEHSAPNGARFYSLYAHFKDRRLVAGDIVERGATVGAVAESLSPENGWWEESHLHAGMYMGVWAGAVLPGYSRPTEERTQLRDWRAPSVFIADYPESVGLRRA